MTYHSDDYIENHVIYEIKCFVGRKITRRVHFLNYDDVEKWCYINKDNFDKLVVCYNYV